MRHFPETGQVAGMKCISLCYTVHFYFTPGWGAVQSIAINVSLCSSVWMCVCLHGYLKNGLADFTEFPIFVDPGHGLVLFLWHCSMLCSSSFVDYIMFAHNQSSKGDANSICIQSDWQGQIRTGISRCSQLPCCLMISFLIFDCFYFFLFWSSVLACIKLAATKTYHKIVLVDISAELLSNNGTKMLLCLLA